MNNLSLGISYGLIAMLGFGSSTALIPPAIKKWGHQPTIFLRAVFTSSLLFIVVLLEIKTINFSLTYIVIAFLIAVIGYLPLISFFKALEIGKVGMVSPITSSSVIFTVILSTLFFKESLTNRQTLAIVLIVIGIIAISINFQDWRQSELFKIGSSVFYSLITALLWGLVFFLFKIPVGILGPILSSFLIEVGVCLCAAIYLILNRTGQPLKSKINRQNLLLVFWPALGVVVGSLFYNLGISQAPVSLIAPLTFANPLIAILYGKLVYKEKLTTLQYGSISLIIAGIILIAFIT